MRKIAPIIIWLCFLATISDAKEKNSADSQSSPETRKVLSTIPASPEDVDALVKVARSPRLPEREEALKRLADPNPKAYAKLGEKYDTLLDNDDPKVRDSAVEACGKMEYREAIPKIRKILKSMPKHSIEAKEGFNPESLEEHQHALTASVALSKMKDWDSVPDMLDREALAVSWSNFLPSYGSRVMPLIVEKARSKREVARFHALRTIEMMNDDEDLPQLKDLMSDKDQDIRTSAITALTRIKSGQGLATVEAIYEKLNEHDRAGFIAASFMQGQTTKGMDYARSFIRQSTDAPMKANVIEAMGFTLRPEVVPYLEGLLKDPDDTVRSEAACQLARITGRRYQYAESNWTKLRERHCEPLQKIKK